MNFQKGLMIIMCFVTLSVIGWGYSTVNSLNNRNVKLRTKVSNLKSDLSREKQSNNEYVSQLASVKGDLYSKDMLLVQLKKSIKSKNNKIKHLQYTLKSKKAQKNTHHTTKLVYHKYVPHARVASKQIVNKSPSGKKITVNATSYTAFCAGCSGVTTTGINLKANPNKKVIAVDPSIIPLGSTVYVPGYGTAVAGDTGGAIKGAHIDVFLPDRSSALSWGSKTLTVTLLK